MKKLTFLLWLIIQVSFLHSDSTLDEKKQRLADMEETISSMRKWQGQYKKKQHSFQSKSSRVLFKNSTDARNYKVLAEEAKKNVLILEDQIQNIENQKIKFLQENPALD